MNHSAIGYTIKLIVINTINQIGTRPLTRSATDQSSPFYDVNADNNVSLLDVLVVINAINRAMPSLSISSTVLSTQHLDQNGVVSGEPLRLIVQFARHLAVSSLKRCRDDSIPIVRTILATLQKSVDFVWRTSSHSRKPMLHTTAQIWLERFDQRMNVI